jgi:hypothetical protein
MLEDRNAPAIIYSAVGYEMPTVASPSPGFPSNVQYLASGYFQTVSSLQVNVTPAATPTITTSQQAATAVVGTSIADQATVTGGFNPTGTVTFNLYNNSSGTGTPLFTDTEPLSSGMATSKSLVATTTGTDYWVATYNGDSNNASVTSGTALEPVAITPATPAISTTPQPAGMQLGSQFWFHFRSFDVTITDGATVSGAFNPTGTVTFNLYNNPNGTGTPLFTDTEPLSSGMATSAGYWPTVAGTDYWVATYNGDSNNAPVTSGTALEPVVITPAAPFVYAWPEPATATVGSPIADNATVSGAFNPTVTVTFNLYNNPNGTGTPLFTDTEPLSSGMAASRSFVVTTTGTAYWVATYNGDNNNLAGPTGAAQEPVTINSTFSVASFAGYGLWRHSDSGGWQQLTAADASTGAVDDHGNVVAAFFNGVWLYEDMGGWQRLTPAIPSQIAIAGNGIVVGNFPGNGLWRYGDPRAAGGGWQQLSLTDAVSVGIDDAGDTITSLPGIGTFLYQDGTGWQEMSPAVATQVSIATTGGSAVAVFQGSGVWHYNFGMTDRFAAGWQQLTSALPQGVAIGPTGAVVCQFTNGVWLYQDLDFGWVNLSPAVASQVAMTDTADVLAEFGNGIWEHTSSGWQLMTPANAKWLRGAGG